MKKIKDIFTKAEVPLSPNEVLKRLHLSKKDLKEIKAVLEHMAKDGELIKIRDKYISPKKAGLYSGTVASTHNGYGFFVCDALNEDLKIVNGEDLAIMNGDKVIAVKRGTKCDIIRITERANKKIIGKVMKEDSRWFVLPDDSKIHEVFILPKAERANVELGDKVVAEIAAYPTKKANGICNVIENLGASEDDETTVLGVLRSYDVDEAFPAEVLDEAEAITEGITEGELNGRLDLRELLTVTIDGDDAKDLDDAVSLEMTDDGNYLLGVHIADVSHYVKWNSIIDNEAKKRATSVYVPGSVYPMLPKKLSNGVCSLNENEDRLTLSCFMKLSRQGKTLDYSIQPAVIKSKHRMTYGVVTDILENESSENRKKYSDVTEMLFRMHELAEILISAADQRGYIEFDLPEAKITLDENNFPIKIEPYPIGISNKIIEQFMLTANNTVAEYMDKKGLPCLYRTHQPPEEKKLRAFRDLIEIFNYSLPESAEPSDFNSLLKAVKGSTEEHLIEKAMLRTMSKAKYKSSCDGHFGLAMDKYLHFTSPIRRYPDLIVHRVLHMAFDKQQGAIKEYGKQIDSLGEICTDREIAAASCERDVSDIRKAQYMSKHIGEVLDATVSGVTGYGIYAENEATVEGFIPLKSLNGHYEYDEARYMLFSDSKKYTLGDKITVKVHSVDIQAGKVELELLGDEL